MKLKSVVFFAAIFFIFFITILVGFNNVELPFGTRIISFESDSMVPTIFPGSLIIIHKEAWYEKGDIITFWSKVKEKEILVTHRINRIGGNVYVTKGDSNYYQDYTLVVPRLIDGRVVMIIPYLGFILEFFRSKIGLTLFMIPVVFVIYKEIKTIKN
ncbi:MAG: signal peptidase I [Candidatus Shapirobacteria bacterium]|nr:signal peptidase I [Candidatus Shapirobacteria bacterium]MDD4410645.1 signal peptidase I [Candidatus Shapirobacteria bacterium]